MADSDTISGIENLKSAVSGETPAYQYKDPNTDMMKAISKCIDAADGTIDDQYEYKNPNTDIIKKMDELATAISEGGGGSGGLTRMSWDDETHNVQYNRQISIDHHYKLNALIVAETFNVGVLSMPVTLPEGTIGLLLVYDLTAGSVYSDRWFPTIFCSDNQMTGVTDYSSSYGYVPLKQETLSSGQNIRNLVSAVYAPSNSFYFNIQFGICSFENIRLYAITE